MSKIQAVEPIPKLVQQPVSRDRKFSQLRRDLISHNSSENSK
jgi:hypothetical protein